MPTYNAMLAVHVRDTPVSFGSSFEGMIHIVECYGAPITPFHPPRDSL